MKIAKFIYVILVFEALIGCKKPYNPPAAASAGSYLVVEGVINTAGITTIKLNQTVPLGAASTVNPVQGAAVTIQSNQSNSYPLTEIQPGVYQSAVLSLSSAARYRLSISTASNQQYLSDFEAAAVSPPIDSVGYNITGSGLQFYVNTHDPTNSTKYYRWDYNETWQFHSEYQSFFITNGTAIVYRTPQQNIYTCFSADTASNIILASTAHLSQVVVYQNPLTSVSSTSEKIETEYSIQVNQYALDGNAYDFWSTLREDTENLGSIFDPQPSNINGNIHSTTNQSTPVIGYVSVCAVQSKRIFIYNSQLPGTWSPTYPYSCELDSFYFVHPHDHIPQVQLYLIPLGSINIPTNQMLATGGVVLGYMGASADCVDCTLSGTTHQPPFWQ